MYQCQYCKKEISGKSSGGLKEHEKHCKLNPNRKEYKTTFVNKQPCQCEFCNKTFGNKGALAVHYKSCEQNPNKQEKVKEEFICQYCGQVCYSKFGISNHENHCNKNPNKQDRKDINYNKNNIHNIQYCKYCNKECHNLNSLKQHEIRCKNNPDRKSYDKLTNYIINNIKGKTKDNCEVIAKQAETLRQKYKNGYVSPVKGKHRVINYIYKEHNDKEIQKWLDYLKTIHIQIPLYDITINKDPKGYIYISNSIYKENNSVKFIFEHDYLMNLYLQGGLEKQNTVHHIDINPKNNNIFNLMTFETNVDHKRFHNSDYAYLTYNEETHKFICILKK